ncbi:hypothetical protein NX059_011982 [Plenodomus lindquistii]|nr:hypothetical protein NX059_011982 [Plenodomus lindquistii]
MADSPAMENKPTASSDLHDLQSWTSDSTPTAITIIPSSKVPALPAELWAEICTHTDARTLWNGIRLASRMLLAEAEREMRRSHLSKLRLRWRFYYTDPVLKHPFKNLYVIERLSHFSEDGQRVFFDVDDGLLPRPVHGSRLKMEDNIGGSEPWILDQQRENIIRAIRYREYGTGIDNNGGLDRSIIFAGRYSSYRTSRARYRSVSVKDVVQLEDFRH